LDLESKIAKIQTLPNLRYLYFELLKRELASSVFNQVTEFVIASIHRHWDHTLQCSFSFKLYWKLHWKVIFI